MASLAELEKAVETARAAGCDQLVLLKCTSTYPASAENTNIQTIPHLRDLFGTEVGLSDHTMGLGVAVASVALGASVIEKHFTLSRADGGVDSAFSLEPNELHALVTEAERAWKALGQVRYGPTDAERKSLVFCAVLFMFQLILRKVRPSAQKICGLFALVMGRHLISMSSYWGVRPGEPIRAALR